MGMHKSHAYGLSEFSEIHNYAFVRDFSTKERRDSTMTHKISSTLASCKKLNVLEALV